MLISLSQNLFIKSLLNPGTVYLVQSQLEKDGIFTDLHNHILILAKYCMYAPRCNNCMSSVQLFVAKVYSTSSVDENISREKGTLNSFIDKWKSLI